MMDVIALAASLFVADTTFASESGYKFPYLPRDLCVDYTIRKNAVAPDCPVYYFVNPKTGTYAAAPLPEIIDYDSAYMINGLIMIGDILLKKKSTTQ